MSDTRTSVATWLRKLADQAEDHPESRGPASQAAWDVVGAAHDWLVDNVTETARGYADALDALARIQENAGSWHGVAGRSDGHAKALAVIATWCDEALAQADRLTQQHEAVVE